MQIEEVDLAVLADDLVGVLGGHMLEGFVRGRTVLRDVTIAVLACSELEAETLVETMIGRGFLSFSGDPALAGSGGTWRIERIDT